MCKFVSPSLWGGLFSSSPTHSGLWSTVLEEGPRREPHLGDGAVQPMKSNLRRRGESAQGSSSGVVELPGGVAARNVPVSTTEDFSPLEEADPREANSPEGTEEDLTPQDPSESYMRMQS